jgi:hypothetical protein
MAETDEGSTRLRKRKGGLFPSTNTAAVLTKIREHRPMTEDLNTEALTDMIFNLPSTKRECALINRSAV